MKPTLAPLILALLLTGCAEIPPPDAAVQTEAAAIAIGKPACKPAREKQDSDTRFKARIAEYEQQLRAPWEARYAGGKWSVGSGHRFSPSDKKCFDLQVTVDARTGKPADCTECIIVG